MDDATRMLAVIVQRGYQETFDVLAREFRPKGVPVFWDRRWIDDRRQRQMPVAVERRAVRRRHVEPRWNVLHFCVVQVNETNA